MIIYIYISIILFIMGAYIGSFINALADRIYLHDVTFTGRSKCLSCEKTLTPIELIPVISFIIQRGKCRSCGARIPSDLFITEVITGIFYVLVFFTTIPLLSANSFIYSAYFLFTLFIISAFIYIAVYDWKFFIISDVLVYGLIGLVSIAILSIYLTHLFGYQIFSYSDYNLFLIEHILTAVLLFVFFYAVYFFTKGRGIGGGDVKLSFLIGLLLGAKPSIIFLYVAFFSGALVSSILLLTKSKGLKDAIPFGPFLSLGVIIALLYSGWLLQTPLFNFVNYFSSLF